MKLSDEMRADFARISKREGEAALLAGCIEVLRAYAEVGARQVLTKRLGNCEIACERCRERDAQQRQWETSLARAKTKRPIGGGAPSQSTYGGRDVAE